MTQNLRVLIPVRDLMNPEFYDPNYKVFLKEFISFDKVVGLKSLLDEREKEYQIIDKVSYKIIYSSKYKTINSEIDEISKSHKHFHTDYISEFIDLRLFLNREIGELTEVIINHILEKLSIIIHLSYNTKVDFLSGIIFKITKNNSEYVGRTKILISDIDNAYIQAHKINWPKIQQPKIKKTVNWFIDNNLHLDGLSKTPSQKAVNALSYNFFNIHEKDTSNLFWTMVGIESLLAEGSNSIINQIKTKVNLILGEPKEFKKKLDKLYNYRSRFVHGDINFPAKFSADYDKFEMEYWENSHFALSILIALLKNMIIENKHKFEFKYILIH